MKQSILLVEDYPVIQDLYSDALKQEGFWVDAAGDGDAALQMVESRNYDFVLLDLLLPHTSGIEFLEKFKQRKNEKIIVLSDFAYEKTIDKAFKLGVDNYWIKSENNPSQLAEKLANYRGEDGRPKSKDSGLA